MIERIVAQVASASGVEGAIRHAGGEPDRRDIRARFPLDAAVGKFWMPPPQINTTPRQRRINNISLILSEHHLRPARLLQIHPTNRSKRRRDYPVHQQNHGARFLAFFSIRDRCTRNRDTA
jgi:hypothetical protein